ncbi:MAG: hypothetical protein HYY31_06385 [Chloroflexi bacterium]|nr:hypothetical protein [Chloroflexota bacterium]
MATEFYAEFKRDVAVSIAPVGEGRLEVYLDGQKLFDRKAEGGIYPDLLRVRQMKKAITEKLAVVPATR